MAKVVIDAGSTSTKIAVIADKIFQFKIDGINAATVTNIENRIRNIIDIISNYKIESIYYFGSGCLSPDINNHIKFLFQNSILHHVDCTVDSDLLGAAIAIYGKQPGWISIIGTGSNIGYFDGQSITKIIPSGGHLIGDEGSGYHIGKVLFKKYIRNEFSNQSIEKLSLEKCITTSNAVPSLYQLENPKPWIASWTESIYLLREDEKDEILDEVFEQYFQLLKSIDHPITSLALSGSIAFNFQDKIRKISKQHSIDIKKIVLDPIIDLIEFYQNL